MDASFNDIAGVITDGSGPLDGDGLGRLVASGVRGADMALDGGEEFAIAGLNARAAEGQAPLNGKPAPFMLVRGAAEGPFEKWETTGSVSQFGEAGAGAWAAVRAFPDSQKIWLARDQFGQQPLYCAEQGATTAFATDLNWFFQSGFLEPRFNRECFGELVQLQFQTGGPTAYEGIRRVFPGETLVIERGRVVDRMRRPAVPLSDRTLVDPTVACDALDEGLNQAIDGALTDVRHPACVLSGDLASTVLAIAIARRAKRRVTAYIPHGVAADQSSLQGLILLAKSLGFLPVPLCIDAEAFFQSLPRIQKALAEPIGDYAAAAWLAVGEAAKTDGATLISSAGGQELFGAYARYRTAARPLWLGGRAMRGRGHLQGIKDLPDGPQDWRDGLTGAENRLRGGRFTRLQALQLVDISTWLPNDTMLGEHQIIVRMGVEVRRPFLDPDLSGMAFSLSDRLKVRGEVGGRLLRQWIRKTFPAAQETYKSGRIGLALPDWIGARAETLGPLTDRIIAGNGLLADGHAQRIFERCAQKGTKRLGMAAWQLLSFVVWYRLHIDGAAADGPLEDILSASG